MILKEKITYQWIWHQMARWDQKVTADISETDHPIHSTVHNPGKNDSKDFTFVIGKGMHLLPEIRIGSDYVWNEEMGKVAQWGLSFHQPLHQELTPPFWVAEIHMSNISFILLMYFL
jgi:hypothetical protein